jgi:hypothetical protein
MRSPPGIVPDATRPRTDETRLAGGGFRIWDSLVAGDGFEPTTFGL